MPDREQEIERLQELWGVHRSNIRDLEKILARYGTDRPSHLLSSLEFEREQLQRVEEELAALQKGPLSPSPVESLAEQVHSLLEVMGYTVDEQYQADDQQHYMVCLVKVGLGRTHRVLIGSVEGAIERLQVEAFEAEVRNREAVEGLLITNSHVTPEAQKRAGATEGQVRLFTLSQFYRLLVDFEPYIRWFEGEYAHLEIEPYYVDLGCEKRLYDEQGQLVSQETCKPIDDYVDAWLRDPARRHISILGDFGTGKTWFCWHYAAKQMARYQADPDNQRLPVFIYLREYTKAGDIRQVITDLLVNRYEIKLTGGYKAFEKLNANGKLLLIFDGFDEMESRVGQRTMVRNFWELAKVVAVPGSKALLTCRTPYFKTAREVQQLFGRGEEAPPPDPEMVIDLRDRPEFEVMHLLEFTPEDVRLALQKRRPDDWEEYETQIQATYHLPDLAQRPVMLDMLVRSLPDLEKGATINPATLYEAYTGGWIRRSIHEDRRVLTNLKKARFFMEELAWEMFKRGEPTLHYSSLPQRVQRFFGLDQAEKSDHFAQDLRTQTYLRRDAAGHYSFAHRSFEEFFVARRLYKQLWTGVAPEMKINEEVRGFIYHLFEEQYPPYEPPQAPEGMVYVPPGPFIMGQGDDIWIVLLTEGFFMDRYPVTNARYRAFVEAGGYGRRKYWTAKGWAIKEQNGWTEPRFWRNYNFNAPDQPVVGITWYEAVAYCHWLAERTGKPYRLPTEAEWEKAARGLDGRMYPWGETFEEERCNTAESDIRKPTPVGHYSPQSDSPYGISDLAGNVWEWTSSLYRKYPYRVDDGREDVEANGWRVVRGGSWLNNQRYAHCAARDGYEPVNSHIRYIGFRVCVSGSSSSES